MNDDLPSSEYLSDLSAKDKRWDKHRASADAVEAHYRGSQFYKYAARMDSCAPTLKMGVVSTEDDKKQFKLQHAHFCRVRHCPVCQGRRSLKWQARLFEAMPGIMEKYPTHRWIFLTLTVKNCDLTFLRAMIEIMNRAFIRLTKLVAFPGVGWIKSLEVTRNATTGQAHPHFHCLILVPSSYFGKSYIKAEKWRELWQQCLRVDYLPIVNIKTVKGKTEGVDGLLAAVCETLKYSVKEEDLIADRDWLIELTRQLHKSRAVSVGGCLRDFLREEKEDDDLINIDINIDEDGDSKLPESEYSVYFGYRENIKRYKLNKA